MTRPCDVCGRPGPADRFEFVRDHWFHMDPDGIAGPLAAVWICGAHDPDDPAVVAVARDLQRREAAGVEPGGAWEVTD